MASQDSVAASAMETDSTPAAVAVPAPNGNGNDNGGGVGAAGASRQDKARDGGRNEDASEGATVSKDRAHTDKEKRKSKRREKDGEADGTVCSENGMVWVLDEEQLCDIFLKCSDIRCLFECGNECTN